MAASTRSFDDGAIWGGLSQRWVLSTCDFKDYTKDLAIIPRLESDPTPAGRSVIEGKLGAEGGI